MVDVHNEKSLKFKFRRRSYRCGPTDFKSVAATVAELERLRITDLVIPFEYLPAHMSLLKDHFRIHIEIRASNFLDSSVELDSIVDHVDELHLLGLDLDLAKSRVISSLRNQFGSRLFVGIETQGPFLGVLRLVRALIIEKYQIFLEPSLKSKTNLSGWTIFQMRALIGLVCFLFHVRLDRNWGRLPLGAKIPSAAWPLRDYAQKTILDNLEGRTPFLSFVIPVRQQGERYFLTVLNQLGGLKESACIEVIVVDDGSDPSIVEQVLKMNLNQVQSLGRLMVITWTRAGHPDLFRAGQARNLGAALASSELLFFLDGDILVPPDLVSHVRDGLFQNVDVLQFIRHHIDPEKSVVRPLYHEVGSSDLSIEESSYWRHFFECSSWMSLKNYWKYTCTYALVMRAQDFWECGGFSENFLTYGFEDTQLGYRLACLGKKFQLSAVKVYHLSDELKGRFGKSLAIQRSAKIFFLNHMEPQLFRTFKFLMVEFPD